jgi:DNA segregation ATPase FtsK/SpoIIIE, S-DNA-T family
MSATSDDVPPMSFLDTGDDVSLSALMMAIEQSPNMTLPALLGHTANQTPAVFDVAAFPHLLIMGSTGTGKSNAQHLLITSLLYTQTPATLRLLLADTTGVEFGIYNALPHLRHSVVTNVRDIAAILKWCVLEAHERLELFRHAQCRDITAYNQACLMRDAGVDVAETETNFPILPRIVFVIDDLADVIQADESAASALSALTPAARPAGIHVIASTSRPTRSRLGSDVMGLFPARMSFRLPAVADSRAALGREGAERLVSPGGALVLSAAFEAPMPLTVPYLDPVISRRLMRWYQQRKEARNAAIREIQEAARASTPDTFEWDILAAVCQQEQLESGDVATDTADPLLLDAAEIVVQNGHGSTSLLQRQLKVGYGRAARLIDQLHGAGVLGPPSGSKPRDVLVGPQEIARIFHPQTVSPKPDDSIVPGMPEAPGDQSKRRKSPWWRFGS